jgi:thiol-disulfide isomerase/thioredoxin
VLLKQSRDDEGVQELRKYLEIAENGPHAASARTYIAEPERARLVYAPPFSVTTLTGDTVRLDEYHGKVVLLDFWATWCPPCVSATPGLVALHRKFAERSFVMIGISADHGEKPLRSYIEKNSLTWPQHLDDNTLAAMYGVTGFPTYVLIDHEGAVRARKAGWSQDIDQWLEREIDKLLKAIPNGSD